MTRWQRRLRTGIAVFGLGFAAVVFVAVRNSKKPEDSNQAVGRVDRTAAAEGRKAARGSLLPEVGLELGAGTLRHSLSDGGNWTSASVGLCIGPAPQGAVLVSATQTQVSGL